MGLVKVNKTHIDFIHGSSLRDILDKVNEHNDEFPNSPILKEDIVEIRKEEEAYILIYYK